MDGIDVITLRTVLDELDVRSAEENLTEEEEDVAAVLARRKLDEGRDDVGNILDEAIAKAQEVSE
jgi:hypothetical protein